MQQNPPFAQRLASLRSARSLNQVELAEATGLGKTTINKWENGETEPVLSSIRRLAEFFGCTTDYLCGLTEHANAYPSGFWMVDLDQFERNLTGTADIDGHWAFAIPSRVRVVSSSEVDRMEAMVKSSPLPKKRRKKTP
jgi:transcriptional regulator with XRE-family HTH domain